MALGKRTKINLFAICALMLSLAVAAAIIIFGFAQYEYDGADASEEQPSAEQEESLASVDDLAKVYDEDGFLTYIQGAFTQRSIKSSDDAIAAVADMAALVGCEDAASEFASVSDDAYSGIAHYRLQQQQDGIPVYGRQLIVSANESDGTATALNSDYAIYEDVDTSPELTQEEAIRMAERSSGSDSALYAELVIYTLNSEGAGSLDNPRLAWCVELSMERYFIDALSGSVLAEDSLINTAEAATGTGKDVSGNERSFTTTSQDDGSFVMIDPDRNLYCYDLEGDDDFLFYESYINESGKQIIVTVISETSLDGKPTYSISRVFADTGEAATIVYAGRGKYTATNADDSRMEEELSLVYTSFLDAETYVSYSEVEDDDNVWDNAKAVSLFANASISYDYYLDAFGRMGYNGNNTAMYLYFNYPDTDGNAYSKVNLVFTGTDNPIETDTIVHEFTHSVSGSIVHWSEYKGETGALNEGYSDVMAFCQAETSTWVRTNGRYAADPNSKKQPASVGDEYWGDPNDEDDDHGSVHKNSTVVSHVAYLMHESGLSFDEIEQIWYSSLFYLLSDASFQDFANALSSAAMDLGFTDDDLNAISSALSEAGLTVTQKLEKDDESSNESGSSAVSTNVVLVLDTSGSMAGEPVEAIKQAASTFVETAFDSENVQVGLVQFNSEGNIESDFTRDADTLDTAISTFSGVGDTNTEDGLIKAQNLLANSMASRNIVVLMTDGYPNDGCEGEEVSARLKDRGVLLFTLGYFAANDPDAAAAQQYLEGMASPGYHYEVTSTASLEAFFAEMAEQITGVKLMYIQVAGDVGVTVSKDGETLATDGSGEASRTSFGSLTYVRTEDAQTGGGDSGSDSSSGSSSSSSSSSQDSSTASMTKVLRLHEGDSYDVVISANSSGNMSYEIGYVDDSGEYTDFRTFEGISMTADSVASAVAETGTDSYLRVDSDGDGVVDETYHAAANSVGARVDNSMLVSLSLGMSAAITVALVSIVVLVETNRKRKGERI